MKKIIITGSNSYIGISTENWLNKFSARYQIKTLDMMNEEWRKYDFSGTDVVYHVAGIAHADTEKITEQQKNLYYKVNTELAVEVARKAKAAGVKQFIFISSMIVYSGCDEKYITKATTPKPQNFYGDSKWLADQKVRELMDNTFKVVVLRPPMIYGKGCKGNYKQLAKIANTVPIFPVYSNKRSVLYIDNLCEFVRLMIDNEESGIFFPQNAEYVRTSDMVQIIAKVKKHRILIVPGFSWLIKLLKHLPGRFGKLANKAFGDSAYDMCMSAYKENYRVITLEESIKLTEYIQG